MQLQTLLWVAIINLFRLHTRSESQRYNWGNITLSGTLSRSIQDRVHIASQIMLLQSTQTVDSSNVWHSCT